MPIPSPAELPVYARLGLEIESGDGVRVTTSDGKDYLDLYGGHAVALLGHGNPHLVEVLRDQASRLMFQTNLVEVAVRRAALERLAAYGGEGLDRVFLVNTGAEANENALRLAFRATGRSRVVALEGGFHGRTAAAGACTHGNAGWYGFPRAPFEVTHVPVGELDLLDAALQEDVAALILEPVQGVAGAVDLGGEYLRAARSLTASRGAWLIADEVQCGMGRTGSPFAVHAAGVVPDVLTVAKGLGGGFPCSAVLVREEVAEMVGKGDLGTTFGGGPMAAAMIVAVLDLLEQPGLMDQVQAVSREIQDTCVVGPVTAVQGRGLLLGLRCDRPAKEVLAGLRERGILAGGARDPDVVRLMPPLILGLEHVDELRAALEDLGS